MLARLTISNYALIDKLSVDFHPQLNSVTGETGAGKSIILGALGLITGNRADLSVLKDKEKKCIVEGTFQISKYNLKSFFEENDLDFDPVTIVRREISPSGKTRAFINDTPVNLKTLQDLSFSLIDIHSQHQNLELGNQKFQLELVDTVSVSAILLEEYKKQFFHYKKAEKELTELREKSEKANADLDYFQFQFNQLEEAGLKIGEQAVLEAELEQLTHSEEIKEALVKVQDLLDNESLSVLQNLKDARKVLENIRSFLKEVPDLSDRVQSCWFELKDIAEEAGSLTEMAEHNPERMEQVNDRLNLLYSLLQKHHVTDENALIDLKNSFEQKISEAVGYEDEIRQLENELKTGRLVLIEKAENLTKHRKSIFSTIEKSILTDLAQLGMPKSKIEIRHEMLPDFTLSGRDSVSILFSANPDAEPAEISKIASGGEMSRLMLAIKNLLRKSKALPTVIFDEIDSGVSGEIAIKMGAIIKTFSSSAQIINITHLPQIAAKGDAHLQVFKLEENGKTYTSIRHLNENERVEELAKMVSGDNLTEASLITARELLER